MTTQGVAAANEVSAEVITLGRIQLNLGRLGAARAAADRVAAEIPAFGKATSAGLRTALDRTELNLDELADRIGRFGVNPTRLEKLATLTKATDRVVRECFALAAGVLSRNAGLDRGACQQADLFIGELASCVDSSLARPTVPGEGEFLHRAVNVIRRRVPDDGVWDLAVMAHEFGHLVVANLALWDPVNDQILDLGAELLDGWSIYPKVQGEELFCDVFATFALGPAYAATLLLHRLEPTADALPAPKNTHPSDGARAIVVLEALRQMAQGEPPGTRIRLMHGHLSAASTVLTGAAPDSARPAADVADDLKKQTRNAYNYLAAELGRLRYRWPGTHIQPVLAFLRSKPATPLTDLHTTIRDILNAAWLIRLEAWRTNTAVPDGIDERAGAAIRFAAAGVGSDDG
jgi:hypothetical protein